jgi:hypothetical protein
MKCSTVCEAPLRGEAMGRFGGGGLKRPSLKQCASRAAQRSNNEQQIAASKQTTNKQRQRAVFVWSRCRVVVG